MVSIFSMVHGSLYFQWYMEGGYNDATVSIFSMVHGTEVIMMQWCLYFQWYMEERL